MDGIHDIIEQIHHCAFSARLPKRAEMLASTLQQLPPDEQHRARVEMDRVDLIERMARRAAQLACCRQAHAHKASARIADAMRQIFGEGIANYRLTRAGWRQPRTSIADTSRSALALSGTSVTLSVIGAVCI